MKLRSFLGLSFALARSQFKAKNEGSYLGILWYLLSPVLTFFILRGIFLNKLGSGIPYYSVYIFIGLIVFNFFQSSTSEAAKAITSSKGIIKSVNFPVEAIIGAVVLKNLFSHFFEVLILAGMLVFYGLPLIWLVFYFLILGIFVFFIFGFSMALSSLTAHFSDLGNIWSFFSRVLWFATPIFYQIGGHDKLMMVSVLNPVYYFITAGRNLLMSNSAPEGFIVFGMFGYSLVSLIIGCLIFRKLKPKFAEMV